nr:replicative DNA helicase [uncultured Desulfuromonas sp.]
MHLINLQQQILGILLLFPKQLDDVEALLEPSTFTAPMRAVYEDMLQERDFDLISMSARHSQLAKELLAWTEQDGDKWLLPQYCRLLAEGSAVNQIKRIGREIQDHPGTAEELKDHIESKLSALQPKTATEPVDMKTGLSQLFREMERQSQSVGTITGLETGFPVLDGALDGLHPGELVIVAGRPSMGKTALAVNIGQHVARKHGVLMFSLEMSVSQVHKRMLSATAGLPFYRIRGKLSDQDWTPVANGSDALGKLNFHIDETPGIALNQITSKARRMKRKHEIKLIIIDYLQLMMLPRNESRVSALGHVTRSLKNLSKELDVNIILLSQLSRAVDSREDKRPVMADLRESGEIEQDADVILFPYRESAYCRDCRDRRDTQSHNYRKHQQKAEIIIEKQRQGERNISIPVLWRGEFVRFESAA